MPPRSKPSKIKWSKCSACHCIFSLKDQDRHSEICSDRPEVKENAHGFVRECVLFAVVTKHVDGTLCYSKVTVQKASTGRHLKLTQTSTRVSSCPINPIKSYIFGIVL